MTNHTKSSKQYFTVVLFFMLYKAFLTFEPMDEILNSKNKMADLRQGW